MIDRNNFNVMKNPDPKVSIKNEGKPEDVKLLEVKYNENKGAKFHTNM